MRKLSSRPLKTTHEADFLSAIGYGFPCRANPHQDYHSQAFSHCHPTRKRHGHGYSHANKNTFACDAEWF